MGDIHDPWKDLRKDLFGNIEPSVTLEAITVPFPCGDPDEIELVEDIPGWSASISHRKERLDLYLYKEEQQIKALTKKLIKLGHHTPLEAVQYNFYITGISKACAAQMSRHRIGQGHVSGSRRFREAEPRFVYPMLAGESGETAKHILAQLERAYMAAWSKYFALRDEMREGKPVVKKEIVRLVLPVSYAVERVWWINARALRDFFRLRLAPDAEWEIRRIARMVLEVVHEHTPLLFEDIYEDIQRVRGELWR